MINCVAICIHLSPPQIFMCRFIDSFMPLYSYSHLFGGGLAYTQHFWLPQHTRQAIPQTASSPDCPQVARWRGGHLRCWHGRGQGHSQNSEGLGGYFCELGVLLVGVLILSALLFGSILAPHIFWKLPSTQMSWYKITRNIMCLVLGTNTSTFGYLENLGKEYSSGLYVELDQL